MRSRRIVASVAAAGVMAAMTSCGAQGDLEDLSGPEVMDRVREDMATVSSLRIAGEMEQDGATRVVDLALDEDGTSTGDVSVNGARADMLVVDDRILVRGGEDFWAETGLVADAQMAGSFAGQWVALPGGPRADDEAPGIGGTCSVASFMAVVPGGKGTVRDGVPDEPESGYGGMCDLRAFLADFTEAEWDSVTSGETTQIEGSPALELIAEDERGSTRMWVSTGEDAHVLRVVRGSPASEELTLGDYGEPVDVSVPDEEEVLDLSGSAT